MYAGFAPIRATHVKQYFDLLTGIMTDQGVTLKNTVAIGGSQGAASDLLALTAVNNETGFTLRLNLANGNAAGIGIYKQTTDANVVWDMDANAKMRWGPGGGAAPDASLERSAATTMKFSGAGGLTATGPFNPPTLVGTPAQNGLYADNAVRGWVRADTAGGNLGSCNVTGLSDTGTGALGVTWDRDFATALTYAAVALGQTDALRIPSVANGTPPAAGGTSFRLVDAAGVVQDPNNWHILAVGLQ